nr:hypothetical protein F987_02907 [Acinetobacter gyllenbergii NIPH 230]
MDQPDSVTISVTPTIAAKLLIPLLGKLHTSLPDIKLHTLATEAVSDFDRDQVDIAVRLDPSQIIRQRFPLNFSNILFQKLRD